MFIIFLSLLFNLSSEDYIKLSNQYVGAQFIPLVATQVVIPPATWGSQLARRPTQMQRPLHLSLSVSNTSTKYYVLILILK